MLPTSARCAIAVTSFGDVSKLYDCAKFKRPSVSAVESMTIVSIRLARRRIEVGIVSRRVVMPK